MVELNEDDLYLYDSDIIVNGVVVINTTTTSNSSSNRTNNNNSIMYKIEKKEEINQDTDIKIIN
jgi:hypothetical protein